MRRMIDPTKVGGLPSTIEFDKDGNRKVKKNLGVDGKLTLKSLVSSTNPDGDIAIALDTNGLKHKYSIIINNTFHYDIETSKDYNIGIGSISQAPNFLNSDKYNELRPTGVYSVSGCYVDENKNVIIVSYAYININWSIVGYNITTSTEELPLRIDKYKLNFQILQVS